MTGQWPSHAYKVTSLILAGIILPHTCLPPLYEAATMAEMKESHPQMEGLLLNGD